MTPEMAALAQAVKELQRAAASVLVALARLERLAKLPDDDPDRAETYEAKGKTFRRSDLIHALQADLARAREHGMPVDSELVNSLEDATNDSLYAAGLALRARLKAHAALTRSPGGT